MFVFNFFATRLISFWNSSVVTGVHSLEVYIQNYSFFFDFFYT